MDQPRSCNPHREVQAVNAVSSGKKIIVVCQMGEEIDIGKAEFFSQSLADGR